jgi:hypothetical protein
MTRLHCLRLGFFPPFTGTCDEYREDENEEKLILNIDFIDVLKLLKLC